MKKLLVPVFLVVLVSFAFAHSGRTDSCGGHRDHKRGGYHIHNHSKYCACYPDAKGCRETNTSLQEQETITVKGRLIKIAAIGGETTGWAIALESPLEINNKQLGRIEVDPGNKDISGFEDRQVEVTGTLEKRKGIERGSYPVIVIEKISE
jgi:hypothetical protein